jgi:hypothetical protein
MGLLIQVLLMSSFSQQGSAFLDEGNAISTRFKIWWKYLFCWFTQWIITIECVGITFTHTLTFVLDIDNVGIIVF